MTDAQDCGHQKTGILDKEICFREATKHDIDLMQQFLFEHGPNQWNYLPVEGIRAYLNGLSDKQVLAQIAFHAGEMVGFITFHVCEQCARAPSHHAHVTELVVHRDFWGRGIGTALMKAAMTLLASMDVPMFIAERHEEHTASARTLEKNGFEIVDTYCDPERRVSGTQNTTVSRYIVRERKSHEAP